MADSESTQDKPKRTSAAKAEPDASPKQQSAGNGETAPPIPVGQLIAEGSALLGYPSHAVAGALYGLAPDEELEIDAAKAQVENWLQQPVQVDPATQAEEEE